MKSIRLYIAVGLLLNGLSTYGQLSPGKLSDAHAELEGLTNCTKCHTIGNQVPDNKCLDCHKEINSLIKAERGFHASKEVEGKTCVDCHSEHHGRNFDALHFDDEDFDHHLTGYELEGQHDKIDCRECHKPDYIHDPEIKKRVDTWLGMEQECLACHDDFHQGTLDNDCIQCHGFEAFRPAEYFDHNDAEFKLEGAHKEVDCVKCHKETTRNGREFQEFTDLEFAQCIDCHDDVHDGKFGQNCLECHNVNSWKNLELDNEFNHDLTDYPLVGEHKKVDCKECHTSGNYTDPINFSQCKTCHRDYHKGEFTRTNPRSDCKECHTVEQPFSYTLYGLEEHQTSGFKLEGAHMATPCFACHLNGVEERWVFRDIGNVCIDCHENIHKGKIDAEYMPENDCAACHNADTWGNVDFDHNDTDWPLEGAHETVGCRACHFESTEESTLQHFNDLDGACIECHDNVHGTQFDDRGANSCTGCHTVNENWNADNFNHDESAFPLEGKHKEVDCRECHKEKRFEDGVDRVEYKIKKFECIDCHS